MWVIVFSITTGLLLTTGMISAQKYEKINLCISVSPMLFSTTEKRYEQRFVPAVSVLVYDF